MAIAFRCTLVTGNSGDVRHAMRTVCGVSLADGRKAFAADGAPRVHCVLWGRGAIWNDRKSNAMRLRVRPRYFSQGDGVSVGRSAVTASPTGLLNHSRMACATDTGAAHHPPLTLSFGFCPIAARMPGGAPGNGHRYRDPEPLSFRAIPRTIVASADRHRRVPVE